MHKIEEEAADKTSNLMKEIRNLDPERDSVQIKQLEEIIDNDDLRIEHYLKSKKRKAFSFKTVRKYRQRVRAREMIDFLEIPSDSEDDS